MAHIADPAGAAANDDHGGDHRATHDRCRPVRVVIVDRTNTLSEFRYE
jgi:hypothetical protein